ncbi:MAG: hypothetical protein NZ518_01245, partial [Dehalococcoidia bacterium]|nr:hypothetical protein [Dehalococcoidia bacterium]
MAQFDSLTKLEDIATALESLTRLSQLTQASGMIGKTITANVNGEVVSGVVDSVSVVNGAASLIVGDRRIAVSQVTRIGK